MTKAKSEYWQNIVDRANSHTGKQVPFFTLAPMEAVTDTVFRRVVDYAAAPDAYYTEFVNARSIAHPKAKFSVQGRLAVVEHEKLPIAQIWGNRPEDFVTAIEELKKDGYQAIDINMGCPDGTVIKNAGGSDLIRHPHDAAAIIQAAKTIGLPVSVKTRIGFNELETYKRWLPFLLQQDIQVLTVHLRTRKEQSKVPAHYELIDDILAMRDTISPQTLIQFNGDIKDRQAGLALAESHPGIDGIMIGRGIFENPWAFELNPQPHSLDEALELLNLQLDLHDEVTNLYGPRHFQKLKRFFKIYVRSFSYASDLRLALMETQSTTDVRKVLAEFDAQWQAHKVQQAAN
ncbi:tRNA-dihydrouridine synthase [Weissella diestrammenae]|uniref:tRNA-dihydrouridine synthase n=1 Tax=Weissella diestrammenae TaxID=1162633 RepID=A0A7G9T759_9LACO|nr:tRNA-dihydrouridine synthase [Weissella diestrammenae]MCM0582465.1 tRNA-dihydrouridine synthase [Weissella diestrammenae]QNN75934.1 tRNA-dihydrouridine synthase [Weissella diestrammenae]